METMPFVQDIFRRVEQVASVENLNADDRRRYERDLKFYRDYHNTIDYAKEQGREEGIRNTLKKTVQAMRNKGLDISAIANLLDMPEDEVRNFL